MAARGAAASFRRTENRFGLLIVMPAVIAFAAVILHPFLSSLRLSFYRSTLAAPAPVFRGLDNFERLLGDPAFLATWIRTIVFVVCTTGLTFALGLVWAIVLNQSFRGHKLLRSLSLLPWVLPSTVTAFLWAWLLHGQVGLLNAVLIGLGAIAEPIVWLSDATGAMAAVVVAKSWLSTALVMIFFLAALQSLPMELVEAARIDGARDGQVIRWIVMPHLRNTAIVVLVLQAMGNLQQIDVIYAMTGGGPVRATSVLSIEVYRTAFQNWNLGLAAAIGVVWFITISVPAGVYLRRVFRQ